MQYNVFLRIYQLSRIMDRLMGCRQGDTYQCNRVCSFSHRQAQGFTHKLRPLRLQEPFETSIEKLNGTNKG